MSGRGNHSRRMARRDMLISLSKKGESLALWDGLTSPMKGAANSAFVEPEREYGPVPLDALVYGDPPSDRGVARTTDPRGTRRRPTWRATMMAPTGRPS